MAKLASNLSPAESIFFNSDQCLVCNAQGKDPEYADPRSLLAGNFVLFSDGTKALALTVVEVNSSLSSLTLRFKPGFCS